MSRKNAPRSGGKRARLSFTPERRDEVLTLVRAYQAAPTDRGWAAIQDAFAPVVASVVANYAPYLGGPEDARQAALLALLESIVRYPATRGAHLFREIALDVWDKLKRRVGRGIEDLRVRARSRPIDERDRATEAAPGAAIDIARRAARETAGLRDRLAAAEAAGVITAEMRRMLEFREWGGLNAREIGERFGYSHELARRQMNYAMKRISGGARQKAHGRKPRG